MIFVHTADWQIGMRAAHAGEAAGRVREARLAAAKRVVEVAREKSAEFVLVAGDTFENNAVDRVLVQKVADILGGAGVPVFVIPGNHDPVVPGCVWDDAAWRGHSNVRVLREADAVEVGGGAGVLLPSPLKAKHGVEDPTLWMAEAARGARGAGKICVGLAHGTVQGAPVDAEPDYPISRGAAEELGLDYLALGHWHSAATYPGAGGAVRMAYSGTHETTKFGERDSGNVLVVEIAEAGAVPVVTPVGTGTLRWVQMEERLGGGAAELDRVVAALEAWVGGEETTLLDLRISGLLRVQEAALVRRVEQLAAARMLSARVDVSGLVAAPLGTDEMGVEFFPEGLGRSVAARLQELARGDGDEREKRVAERALRELYLMAASGATGAGL